MSTDVVSNLNFSDCGFTMQVPQSGETFDHSDKASTPLGLSLYALACRDSPTSPDNFRIRLLLGCDEDRYNSNSCLPHGVYVICAGG